MQGQDIWNGHLIERMGSKFVYADTKTPVEWKVRDCGKCGMPKTAEGHDACLGTLQGVRNACCGHGSIIDVQLQYEDGVTLNGVDAHNAIQAILLNMGFTDAD